ncbi:MAG: hypothetical protein WBX15_03000, partial [Thermoanaerobaculia bacterium]
MKRLVALFLMLLVAAPLVAADRWWDHYKRGLAAAQSNEWDAAKAEMQKSIALEPNENASARARNEYLVYVPHFWLGLARYKGGDVDGAIREWEISRSQGVIQKTKYFADLQAWTSRAESDRAREAVAPVTEVRKSAEGAVSAAIAAQADAMAAG